MENKFRERLLEMMNVLKVTQQQVSDRSGISKSLISRYIKGDMSPKVNSIKSISNAFGVDPAWLIGYDVPMFEDSKVCEQIQAYYYLKLTEQLKNLNENERKQVYECAKIIFPEKIK